MSLLGYSPVMNSVDRNLNIRWQTGYLSCCGVMDMRQLRHMSDVQSLSWRASLNDDGSAGFAIYKSITRFLHYPYYKCMLIRSFTGYYSRALEARSLLVNIIWCEALDNLSCLQLQK